MRTHACRKLPFFCLPFLLRVVERYENMRAQFALRMVFGSVFKTLLSVNTYSIGEYRRYYILHLLVVSRRSPLEVGDNEVDFA